MSEPILKIPEPSLPEHNLLREAGTLPRLSSGLRERVVLNVHQQARYGRWADRAKILGSVVAACLMVCFVWNHRWSTPAAPESVPLPQDTVQHDAPIYPSYVSPGMESHDAEKNAKNENDKDEIPLPQGGASNRRENIQEMFELNQLIEKLQSRQNSLCGFLPYL
jgi:hypothetical protein